MKQFHVTVNGKSYDVTVEEVGAGSAPVAAAPAPVAAPAAPAPAPAAAPAPKAAAGNGEKVVAPMPGTILEVKASNGASVKKGDVLFILEAMKMENDIVAPCDGTVSSVLVNKGDTVGTNDALATIA